MAEELELILDTESEHDLRVYFSYPSKQPPSADYPDQEERVDGRIHINQGPLQLDFGFTCFGYDLVEFVRNLQDLQATLEGEADFVNMDNSVQLGFEIDKVKGQLAIRVVLESVDRTGDDEFNLDPVKLAGFVKHQSLLPEMTQKLEAFVAATGVSTKHPMKVR